MEKIGSILKEKREQRNLTREEVNSITRIPKNYIEGIEEDNISAFSAEVYYLGSLRRYALFLGFDDNELVAAYKRDKAEKQKQEALSVEQEKKSKPAFKPWMQFVAGLAALVLVVFLWLNFKTGKNAVAPQVAEVDTKNVVESSPTVASIQVLAPKAQAKTLQAPAQAIKVKAPQAAAPVVAVKATQTAVPRTLAAPVIGQLKLEVEALSASWVKVVSDGNVLISATLETGAKREWFANNKFGLVVGYAPGVRVMLNGKEIDIRKAAKQDVSEITLTEEDAR